MVIMSTEEADSGNMENNIQQETVEKTEQQVQKPLIVVIYWPASLCPIFLVFLSSWNLLHQSLF